MVLNEPETSLHPDLLGALARLTRAAENSQVIVVTHAAKLISALSEQPGYHSIVLEKQFGETSVSGMNQMNLPAWHWPPR
jgi:predicted ATPase